jgi:subtilisin family serine protease
MSLFSKYKFLVLLGLTIIEVRASERIADAMKLINAVSEDGQSLVTQGLTGKGVGIAIIDATINKEHLIFQKANIINCNTPEQQEEFRGYHGQHTASPIVAFPLPQGQFSEGTMPGTNLKFTLVYRGGLAPEATLYSYPYMTCSGMYVNEYKNGMKIIDTLDLILRHNQNPETAPIKIINMSFTLTSTFNAPEILDKFKEIEKAGILVIHAANNEKEVRTISAGSLRATDNWLEVGALHAFKDNGAYQGWRSEDYHTGSSYPHPDSQEDFIWAPGHLVPVATGEKVVGCNSGTSFAAPYVAAAAALLWEQNPSLTYRDIKDKLMSCPVHPILMETIKKSAGRTVFFETHNVQRPILDIHHLLGSITESQPLKNS